MSKPTLGSILDSFKSRDPGLIGEIVDVIVSEGIPLDLGPMTPDVRAKFDALTKDARADLHRKFAADDTDDG